MAEFGQKKTINGTEYEFVEADKDDLQGVLSPEVVSGELSDDNLSIGDTKIENGKTYEFVEAPEDEIRYGDKDLIQPGGYLPDPNTVLDKAIPQDMTGVPTYTTDADKFKRELDLRGYDKGFERVRNAASYVFADNQDEIEAGVRSVFGEDYTETRDKLRAQLKNYQVENMGEGIILGIASGVLTGYGALGALKQAPKAYKLLMGVPGASLIDKAKRLTLGGAAFGFATGVGVAPEVEEIPSWTTALYTGGGALASPLMAGAIKGVTKTFGAAKDAIKTLMTKPSMADAEIEAIERIALSLENQGYTARQIEEEILKQKNAGIDRPQFAETSAKSLSDEARRSMAIPSASDDTIITAMGDRIEALPKAMTMKLKQLFDIPDVDMTSKFLNDIAETQSKKAKLKYPEADAILIPTDKFKITINGEQINLIDGKKGKGFFKAFYEKARKEFNLNNIDGLPPYDILIKNKSMSTRTAKKIKRLMQREIDLKKRAGDNSVFDPNGLADIKKQFNGIIEANNPQFKLANKEFGDSARLQEIYQQGQKYNDLDDAALNKIVAGFDTEQLKVFKSGILNQVNKQAKEFKGGNFSRKIFGSEKQKETFKRIMDLSGKDYKEFEDIAKFSVNRVNARNKIIGGSTTNMRQVADSNIGFNSMQIMQTINNLLQRSQIPPAVAENLKKTLLNADEATQRAVIKSIKDIEKRGGVNSKSKAISDIFNNPISQQMVDAPFNITNLLNQYAPFLRNEDTELPYMGLLPSNVIEGIKLGDEYSYKTPINKEGLI